MTKVLLDEIARNLARPDAVRLFHGRGGSFPDWENITVEYYPPVLVIQNFGEEDPRIADLLPQLIRVFGDQVCILHQLRCGRQVDWRTLHGAVPDTCHAVEAGLRFAVTFMTKQNIGFFPDMRLGRKLVRDLARGKKKVLNLFAYTCSLSVAAMAGGAKAVTNMDVSKAALKVGRQNHQQNGQDFRAVQFLSFDIRKSIGRLIKDGPYDLVIIDPPTRQKGRFDVAHDYTRILRRLPEFLAPGADVVACLNAPHLGFDWLEERLPEHLTPQARLGRPPECPEKKPDTGLKIVHARYQA